MATVLYTLLDVIRHLAILMQPVVPGSANIMLDQLGVAADARTFADLGPDHRLAPGTALPKPAPVFPRHVEAE
jgi:methionyl-tRNA synthetase